MANDAKVTASVGRKRKFGVFDFVNYLIFIIVGLVIILPIWKVVVDSFNAVGVYKFLLWPTEFTIDGYKTILETSALYRPFINSVITTVVGTLLGLVLCTLGDKSTMEYCCCC